jgi:long-chain-alcohol oxidase
VQSKNGTARVHYQLSEYDQRHLRQGIEAGARILEAAGAREIFTSQSAFVSYRPGQRGGIEAFMDEVDRRGYGPGQMAYVSFHQMGSCRMGLDPATSVIGEDAQCHQVKGLFVADASAFPSASGVNPMLTIMAMAQQASRHVAASC